jgi:hypothetical protein
MTKGPRTMIEHAPMSRFQWIVVAVMVASWRSTGSTCCRSALPRRGSLRTGISTAACLGSFDRTWRVGACPRVGGVLFAAKYGLPLVSALVGAGSLIAAAALLGLRARFAAMSGGIEPAGNVD